MNTKDFSLDKLWFQAFLCKLLTFDSRHSSKIGDYCEALWKWKYAIARHFFSQKESGKKVKTRIFFKIYKTSQVSQYIKLKSSLVN